MELNLADAKARFSEVVNRAEAGESVDILRRGKLVARVVPIEVDETDKERIDIQDLKQFVATLPLSKTPAAELVRQMRDDARY